MWPTFLVHFMFEVPFPHCVMWLVSHYLCTRVGSSCVACCAVTSGPDVIEEKGGHKWLQAGNLLVAVRCCFVH